MPDGGLRSYLSQAKRSFWLFFGAIWLLVGVLMLVIGAGMAIEERAWSGAVRTTGMVLTKDIVRADSDSSTQYRITFRYRTEAGQTVEGDQQVAVATWERLTERGPVDVFYLPGSSDPARLEPGSDPVGALIFLAFGVGLTAVGGTLFGRALLRLMRSRRLLRSGVDADATVSAVEQTDVSFNRRQQFRVRYDYRDSAGGTHAGDSGYLEWEEASAWKVGDTVAVRYDPQRPNESLWMGSPPGSSPRSLASP